MLTRTNISTTLVANELQTSSHDVGTLCTHKNINMWSKWKPINVNATTLTDQILIDNDYGIIAPEPESIIERAMDKVWEYDRPKGGSTSPYRLGDFRGYAHDAVPPVSVQDDITWYVAVSPTLSIELQKGAQSAASIQVSDLKALSNYYLALCVYRNGYWQYVSAKTAGVGGIITLDADDFPVSEAITTYPACLMATTDPNHGLNDAANAALWLSLPNSEGTSFQFNLTIRTVTPLQQTTLTGVSNQEDYSVTSWNWSDPTNYIGADPTGPELNKYYGLNNTYTLQMRLNIQNSSGGRYIFNTDNIRMVMNKNFLVNSEVEVVPIFFDPVTHEEVDSFVVEANTNADIAVSTPIHALRFNTSGVVTGDNIPSGKLIKVSFSFIQNGREIFNRSVRLTNGSTGIIS